MSRTPTMTPAELETILGPRGALIVTSANRADVKKWLTANGLPSLFAGGLALKAMAAIYNDSSNATLEKHRERASAIVAEDSENESTPLPAPLPAIVTTPPATETALPTSKAEALAALLELLGSNGKSIDADAVRKIMREELPNLIPTTRIEIVTPSETTTHDGELMHKQLPHLVRLLSLGLHVALVGPAGSGKTKAAEQAAKLVQSEFYIQGAVQGAHDLLGYPDIQGNYHRTPTRDAFEHGGVVTWDEMDAGDPGGMIVANSATANGFMAFPDQSKPVMKHDKFQAIACMNTFGMGADRLYVGRNQMDASTLDRFVFMSWEYDEKLELAIAGNESWVRRVQALRAGAQKEKARIVISPRASIIGAKMLAANFTISETEEMVIWKGTDAELRRRIEAHAK